MATGIKFNKEKEDCQHCMVCSKSSWDEIDTKALCRWSNNSLNENCLTCDYAYRSLLSRERAMSACAVNSSVKAHE